MCCDSHVNALKNRGFLPEQRNASACSKKSPLPLSSWGVMLSVVDTGVTKRYWICLFDFPYQDFVIPMFLFFHFYLVFIKLNTHR